MDRPRASVSSPAPGPSRWLFFLRWLLVLLTFLPVIVLVPGEPALGAQATDVPPRQERTDVIFTPGGQTARVYDPTVDGWLEVQTPDPIVAVVTGDLRRDSVFADPNFRDQPDDMPLNNGVLIATTRQLVFYEPTANNYISVDLPAGEQFSGANVADRQGEILAVAHTNNTGYVYNASRNAWMQAPALTEGLDPNLTQVSSTGAIVASGQRALVFDLVRNDWIELSVPAGQTIQATALPVSPEPGFTSLVLTDNGAYTYDVGTDQWIGHTMPGPVRSFAIAEASPVVASEHAVAVYDPVTNQWVQQDVGVNVSIPRNGVLASRNTALAVTGQTGYVYNRSRHQWEQVPAPANEAFSGFAVAENTGVFWTPEGTAYVWDVNRQQFVEGAAPPNARIVSGTMNQNLAVVTTDQGAMIYDPGTNQWSHFQVPANDIPTPPGAPNFSVSRFTTVLTTNTNAFVWNQGTHQFDQVTTSGNIRLVQTSENAAVVATDDGAYVYDPTLNQWVEVQTPLVNEPITGIDTARNTVVVRSENNAWFYNRSTHQWVQLAAPANETWNVQMALENTALVCSERNAAVWDPTRDEWVQLSAGGDASVLRDGNSFMVVTGSKAFVYNRSRHEWQETDMPAGGGAQGGRRQPVPCGPKQGDGDEPVDDDAVVQPPPEDPDQIDDLTGGSGGQPARSVVLVLDASGSMGDNNKIDDAKAAAKSLLQSLSGAEVALIIYYDCTSLDIHEFTMDPASFEPVIDAVYASGGTPLYMSIGVAYDLMEKKASADQGDIIVLTDGGESCQDDEDRNREAATSWSQRRIPWVRRTQKQSSAAPGGDLQAAGAASTIAELGTVIARGLFLPGEAHAQQVPGKINLHLVGFQIDPSVETQLQEMMNLAQGQYYPAGDVNSLTQALRTAAGTGTTPTGGSSAALPLLIVVFMVALAAIFFFIWQMSSRRQVAPAMGPAGGRAGQIVVTRGQAMRQAVGLDKPLITIGRDPASSLAVMDPQVSRQHAQIRRQAEGVILYDLGSVNGTYVNGRRVAGTQLLNPGDVIRVGNTELSYQPAGMVPPMTPYGGPAGPYAPGVGARLMLVQGTGHPPTLDLGQKPFFTLGRDSANDVIISADSQVSRQHAQIRAVAGGYEIIDMGSANGLFVNGQRVPRATLRPGDRIRVGSTEFTYQG